MKSTVLLDPWRVKPFADQPRKRFRGIPQLAESIRLVGQVTPIIVTACRENGFDAELVDGERRLQACRLGKMRIKAVFEGKVNAAERFALSIAANFCRQEHDCLEVAEAIQRLKAEGRSIEEIAGIFGKGGSWVHQHTSLLSLHPDVQEMLKRAGDEQKQSRKQIRARGRMTLSIALLLVPLSRPVQLQTANHIVKNKLSMAAARSYVLKIAAAKNTKVGHKRSPKHDFIMFWNAMDTFRHRIDRLSVVSHAHLQSMLGAASDREAKALAGQIDEVCDNLKVVSHELRKVSKK